jgi:predicted secreted protein
VQNYINYFTEIEERFQQRRGSLLLLSTLDWALIESWREAEVPLAAVLRGIDAAFDKHETKKATGRVRRVNGLAWCAQAVMEAAEQMREAATGATNESAAATGDTGFEAASIRRHLLQCAAQLEAATGLPHDARSLAAKTVARLRELADDPSPVPEVLEQTLRALEEKLLAMVTATSPEALLAALRAQAAQEIAPFRRRMQALQIRQIETQFLEKRLLEKYGLPRLSLFYMRSEP